MRTRLSRGFTLVELLISMLIVGVIGGALTKLLMSQNRYYDHETNRRNARSIARSATNILMADLRMVQDNSGVDSVGPEGKLIRILVPYRFGVVCGTSGNTTTVSMLPIDSGTVSVSVYRGFAWRDSTVATSGRYTYESAGQPDDGRPTVGRGGSSDMHGERRRSGADSNRIGRRPRRDRFST